MTVPGNVPDGGTIEMVVGPDKTAVPVYTTWLVTNGPGG